MYDTQSTDTYNVIDPAAGQTPKLATFSRLYNFKNYLRCVTKIQSDSDPLDIFSRFSSTSLVLSTLIKRVRRLLRVFFFAISASTFSTTSRISDVLKTNRPFNATRLPFLRCFRVSRSPRCSVFSFRKRVISVCIRSRAEVARVIYRFVGELRTSPFSRTLFNTAFACRSSVPSGGELARSEVSNKEISVVEGCSLARGVSGMSRVQRTEIGLNRERPVARKLERIVCFTKARSRAFI